MSPLPGRSTERLRVHSRHTGETQGWGMVRLKSPLLGGTDQLLE